MRKFNCVWICDKIAVNDLSSSQNSVNKNIIIKTLVLRSYFLRLQWCIYCCKMTIDFSATAANENDKAEKDVALKNNFSFRQTV